MADAVSRLANMNPELRAARLASSMLSRRPKKSSGEAPEPKVTWAKATPLLIVAGIFDVLKFFFAILGLAAPLFIGVGVGAAAGATSGLGSTVSGWIGSFAGTIAGGLSLTASPLFEAFGVIMALIVAGCGFATALVWMAMLRVDFFEAGGLRLALLLLGFVVGETPIIDAVPSLTPIVYFILRNQMKLDEEELERFRAGQEQRALEGAQQQRLQMQAFEQQRVAEARINEEDAAANDAIYAEEAANDASYGNEEIPDTLAKAA